jgi:hypothetical protein
MVDAIIRLVGAVRTAAPDLLVWASIWTGVMVGGLCLLVAICLRGTGPVDRPAILYALADVVHALRGGHRNRGWASQRVDESETHRGQAGARKRWPRGHTAP